MTIFNINMLIYYIYIISYMLSRFMLLLRTRTGVSGIYSLSVSFSLDPLRWTRALHNRFDFDV